MNAKLITSCTLLGGIAACCMLYVNTTVEARPLPVGRITQGALLTLDREGNPAAECPLKHTDVKAEITGFLARVQVTQEFQNSSSDKIEAVYAFPLPHGAAVDSMNMLVGDRTVKGLVKRREEARAIYEAARTHGKVAGLLDQERPNIFTQSVANVMPGATVKIVISYVERLQYEAGTYEFVFPMVVGPRYITGNPTTRLGGGWSYDTDKVPDASRITPVVAKPGTRAGHDISVEVKLDAGVPLDALTAPTHDVLVERPAANRALVTLKDKNVLPNKDFILRYDVAGRKIQDTVLTHRGAQGGFFTLILQPPDKLDIEDITPKELVFVLDTSGSMNGFPIEKAKEAMSHALKGLNPHDTFNLITFAGDTHILFPQPVAATAENLQAAQDFLAARHGSGGTEMMKAIRAALNPTASQKHLRVVCFMTDGYVGNEAEIISEIRGHPNARVFSFGIGTSVNRYLLDKMAEAGRGEVEYVSLKDDGSAAAKRFHERIRNPLLTEIAVEWNGLPVADVYPARVPDLFSAKPLVLTGRYNAPAKGNLTVRGKVAGRPVTRHIPVDLPANQPDHAVLATLWARARIDDLMHSGLSEAQAQITQLGLEYKLMTPYTSFVAVEEVVVSEGGEARRVEVPVEMPEGVSYQGTFGDSQLGAAMIKYSRQYAPVSTGAFSGIATVAPAERLTLFAGQDHEQLSEVSPARKLHPDLEAGVAKLARNGVLHVQVWLSATNVSTVAQVQKLGLEITAQPNSTLLIGRISVGKLRALSELKTVRYIAPLR